MIGELESEISSLQSQSKKGKRNLKMLFKNMVTTTLNEQLSLSASPGIITLAADDDTIQ